MPDLSAPIPDRRAERIVLGILAAAQFINMVDFVIVMPLGPQLMRSLNISPQQFGLIVSSYTVTAGLAGVLAALFIDRFDRKTAFIAAFFGFALGTLCCGWAESYVMLLTARAATGAFGGLLGGMALTIIGDVFPDERRGAATGALMSSFGLASVIGVPLGLKLSSWFGSWHAPFWMLGLPSLAVLAVSVWLLPSLRRHLSAERPNPMVEIGGTLANRAHLIALTLVGVLTGGAFLVVPFLGTYFVNNCRIAEPDLPWVYVIGGAVALCTSNLVGRVADRYGRFLLFSLLAPLSGLVMFAATVMGLEPLAVVALMTALLMVCNSGRMIVAMTMINAAVEPRRRGSFMGLNSAVQHLASGAGSFAGATIVGSDELQSLTGFGIVGAAALVSALASVPLAARLVRPRAASAELVPAELRAIASIPDSGAGDQKVVARCDAA
jgi:MFS transporter, DHA1 family, inner membrane transport protein